MNAKLIVTEQGRDRVHELCDDVVVVGRGPAADLHLRDAEVAPSHCEIRRTDKGFKVVDLETTVGTLVNGDAVNAAFLQNGDTIEIGGAKITYLGPSAAAAAKQKPAPAVLRELPTDEEGRPRRFYRHESTGKRKFDAAKFTIIVAILGALALIIVTVSKKQYGDPDLETFTVAQRLITRGDEPSLAEAIKLLEPLAKARKQFSDQSVSEILEEAKSSLHSLRTSTATREEDQFYAETINWFRSHPEDAGYLKARVKIYESKWPESSKLAELRQKLEIVEAGGPEREAEWRGIQDQIRKNLSQKNYKDALRLVADAEANPTLQKLFRDKLSSFRTTITREFQSHYERRSEQALDAKSKGDAATAERIYLELAEVGIDPFSSEARRFLEKLRK